MRDMHECDACGQYQVPDGLACSQCRKNAAVHRKRRRMNEEITGGYDGRDYITGEAGSRPDSDQL